MSIDGTGKYLIPGLFDAHAHPFPVEESFPRFVHYGVTSILITGGSRSSQENLARARALSTGDSIPSPRVFHTSQHFTMEGRHPVKTFPSPHWIEGETVYYLREAGDAKRFVEEVAQQPIVGIKVTIEDGPEPPFVEMIPVAFVREIADAALAILSELYGMADPTLEAVLEPQMEDLWQLHTQGFNLVVGTDTGNDFIFPGLSVHELEGGAVDVSACYDARKGRSLIHYGIAVDHGGTSPRRPGRY